MIGLIVLFVISPAIWFLLYLIKIYFQDADLITYYTRGNWSDLSGKIVVITGATGSLGQKLAFQISLYLGHGTLVLMGREAGSTVLKELRDQCLEVNPKMTVLLVSLDLLDDQSIEQAVQHLDELDRIDYFFHNAGMRYKGLVLQITTETDRELIETNVVGHIKLTKLLLKRLIRDQSRLLVTGSLGAVMPSPLRSTYVATKHALQGFYGSLRMEYPNLQTSLLHMGPIETDQMSERVIEIIMNVATARDPIVESWIGKQPILLFAYLVRYTPSLANWIDQTFEISRKMIRKHIMRKAS